MKSLLYILMLAISVLANNIELTKGWNLVGFNHKFTIENSVLNSDKIRLVWVYDEGWKAYSPNASIQQKIDNTPNIQNAYEIHNTYGVWIYANEDMVIEQPENTTDSVVMSYNKGWNLISAPSDKGGDISNFMDSSEITICYVYRDGEWLVSNNIVTNQFNSFSSYRPNEGIWVLSKSKHYGNYTFKSTHDVDDNSTDEDITEDTIVDNNNTSENNDNNDNTLPKVLTVDIDYTDTDGDGMTDEAELKYGFDPYDNTSLPTKPKLVESTNEEYMINEDAGITLTTDYTGVSLNWENPENLSYSLIVNTSDGKEIYYGGHFPEEAYINYDKFNINPEQTSLIIEVSVSDEDGVVVNDYDTFTIDLKDYPLPEYIVGAEDNRISWTYEGFEQEDIDLYDDLLTKVYPIMKEMIGPPAVSLNTNIVNMGPNSNYFMVSNHGKTFYSTTEYIPRLIIHEMIHAWSGKYLITSDEDWNYDNALSGFEEGLAEGYAMEIVHEFTKAYPNHKATEVLLDYKPYQYYSPFANAHDMHKHREDLTSGDYWSLPGSVVNIKYSVGATAMQIIHHKYPNFYKDIRKEFYKRINEDKDWRFTRENIVSVMEDVAPVIEGVPLRDYINSMPIFAGKDKESKFYINHITRNYGDIGDIQFVITYPIDGYEWWQTKDEDKINKLPDSIDYYKDPESGWYYIDTVKDEFNYEIRQNGEVLQSGNDVLMNTYSDNGRPDGLGWYYNNDINQGNHPEGLLEYHIEFPKYNTSSIIYTFGSNSSMETDDHIFNIGVLTDYDNDLTVSVTIDELYKAKEMTNNYAILHLPEIERGYESTVDITISNDTSSCTYKRTLLDVGTMWDKPMMSYLIKDKDFNCIEDAYEN